MRPLTRPLILGAGPAGCAAAIALAGRGVRPLMIERQRDTGDALCGGFLSWRTLDSLSALGIAPQGARITRVRLFSGPRMAEAALPRPAIGVSRRHLDTLLQARAERAGAAIERGVTVRAIKNGTLRLEDGAEMQAGALFLANGKHELRGARRDAAPSDDPTIGLRTRLPATPGLAKMLGGAIELHLFRGGYAGLCLQEDGSGNLCLAVRRSRLRAEGGPDALIEAIGHEIGALGDRVEAGWGTIDAIANVPYGWRARATIPGIFRLGDQAGVIPSLAGEGMGIAIASGIVAAAAFADGGAASSPLFQQRLAQATRGPIARATLLRDLGERRWGAAAMLAAMRLAPGAAGIAARWTRIGAPMVDDGRSAAHI
ncbi:NAD(P)/FAD-dependent oxidoreductase [Sphingomonas sp.]